MWGSPRLPSTTQSDCIGTPWDDGHRSEVQMEEQGVWVCFVNVSNSQIELIEPVETSPITKFLKPNPLGGQHHICFEVDDLLAARDEMVAKGARVLGEPRIGAHGTPIIFIHPKDMGGVLIELMQSPQAGTH